MKNMVSTIIVFGFIFIIILGSAFLFQKMHGLDSIKDADMKINKDIHNVIDNGTPKDVEKTEGEVDNGIAESLAKPDSQLNVDNATTDNTTVDNATADDTTVDNATTDNTPKDNLLEPVQ